MTPGVLWEPPLVLDPQFTPPLQHPKEVNTDVRHFLSSYWSSSRRGKRERERDRTRRKKRREKVRRLLDFARLWFGVKETVLIVRVES